MILEDEADLFVPEGSELAGVKLKWIMAVQGHRPAGRRFERAENIKQSAFPAARRTHDRNSLATRKRKRDIREDVQCPARRRVFLGDVFDLKQTETSEIGPRIYADTRR
jgi:hypothetical protein